MMKMAIYQINAGPGSGKTYTSTITGMRVSGHVLSMPSTATEEQRTIYSTIAQELPHTQKIVYLAHTNTIKDALKARLPKGTKVYNFHGLGMMSLKKMFGYQGLSRNRTDEFITSIIGQPLARLPYKDMREWVGVKNVVKYLKQEWLPPLNSSLVYLRTKYPDLCLQTIPDDWEYRAEKLLQLSLIPNGKLEYEDMLWMAAKLTKFQTYDLGIVDESQDVSACSYQLLIRTCKDLLFCGDPNQATMAFAGADEAMFDRITEKAAAVFPLKTTFRLPPNIVTNANRLISGSVLPGTNRIPGEEASISFSTYLSKLSSLAPVVDQGTTRVLNTLTLSRTNAQLVLTALALSQKRVPAKMADKELGPKLTKKIDQLNLKSLDNLESKLSAHLDRIRRFSNPLLRMLEEDFCECLLYLSQSCSTIKELKASIITICTPITLDAHLLVTVHGGKGLEAPNIFILSPPIESPLANQHPIGRIQEKHVHFVGITRTKQNQYWVSP